MKGILGYGRYADSPETVGCPRAHSDMTPCVARDGALAQADVGMCVGCERFPSSLLQELVKASSLPLRCLGKERVRCLALMKKSANPSTLPPTCAACGRKPADLLRDHVRTVTKPLLPGKEPAS